MNKQTKTKHTETPWEIERPFKEKGLYIQGKNTEIVCQVYPKQYFDPEDKTVMAKIQQANAQFIIKACNNHYDLLEACKYTLKELSKLWDKHQIEIDIVPIQQAISKAERN